MPQLPQLNQITNYYINSRQGSRGQLTRSLVKENIPCRFSLSTGTFRDSRGQDIEYTAQIHLNALSEVKKGGCFEIDNRFYLVLDCFDTVDLNGNPFKLYCPLKEYSVQF